MSINDTANSQFLIKEFKIDAFKDNLFIPLTHYHNGIPDKPGNYIICLNDGCELPNIGEEINYSLFQNKKVIYTGKASKSLLNRD